MNIIKNKYSSVVCVDLDEVDDKHAVDIINENPRALKRDFDKFFKEKTKRNREWLAEFTKRPGLALLVGVPFGCLDVDYKICLKIDPEVNYRRLMARTVDAICKNKNAILDEINHGDPFFLKPLSIHKYGIRGTIFIPYDAAGDAHLFANAAKHGYRMLSTEPAIKRIEKIIQQKK